MTAILCYTFCELTIVTSESRILDLIPWHIRIGFAANVGMFEDSLVFGQLARFFWIHIAVLFTSLQLFFLTSNIRHGMVWFLLPSILVIWNDVAAYTFGKMLGRTPLYTLSPNKTVEGFMLGAITTVAVGEIAINKLDIAHVVPGNVEYKENTFPLEAHVFYQNATQQVSPKDGLILSLYASFAAPSSGFLASALKRSCSMKDFGNWIPGHGGIVDRMDCQLLMGVFTYVYLNKITTTTQHHE
ncbi:phosphatidate cytidylyltransferase 1 [Lichtheimia corymbifera JMRC:FSU:9682]|uniref:Phosphatidate cytidylyltransferase n=1 Tax=Lichtheimia corymbifera JMRC:FSU:9682 TaxID=1263082 RepID=A0A068RZA4_9FUNG|nr:phosphatidate cytidylyltransferase 1 [Lichtheimia corymbifera JMRC:FSU:9682]